MSAPDAPAPGAHTPDAARSMLFPLAVVSAVLGLLFLLGRVSLGGEAQIVTDAEVRRGWFLLALGGFLLFQGVALALIHLARSEDLAAGVEGPLAQRVRDGDLVARLALLPRVLLAQRRSRQFLNAAVMVVLGAALLTLINYVFARHNLWRIDLTQERLYSLSEESAAVARALDRDVRIVVLLARGTQNVYVRQVESLVDQYRLHSTRVQIERLDPVVLDPEEFQRKRAELELPDRSPGELTGVVVQAGARGEDGAWHATRTTYVAAQELFELDASGDGHDGRKVFRGEQRISTAIREVTRAERPKVYFLAGHDEVSFGDFGRFGLAELARALMERDFEVLPLNLGERERRDVPEDAALLVVAAPRRPLTESDLAGVRAFLDRGGDALFLLEPWTVHRGERTEWPQTGLEPLLEGSYGIRTRDRWVLLSQWVEEIGAQIEKPELPLYTFDEIHPVTKALAGAQRVRLATARPLVKIPVIGAQTAVLLQTDPRWGQGASAIHQTHRQDLGGAQPEREGPYAVVLASERTIRPLGEDAREGAEPRRSRVVVFGDVDWATNHSLLQRSFANLELALNAVSWCREREAHVIGRAPRPRSFRLEMSPTELERFQTAALLGLPALALGVLAWVLRFRS